jgi:hypothetical protein
MFRKFANAYAVADEVGKKSQHLPQILLRASQA